MTIVSETYTPTSTPISLTNTDSESYTPTPLPASITKNIKFMYHGTIPQTGNAKMFINRQNEYLQRKKKAKKNCLQYLQRKVKKGTATSKEKKELTRPGGR